MAIVALMAVILLANNTKEETATAETTDYDVCVAAGGTAYDGVCMDEDGNYYYSAEYYPDTTTDTTTEAEADTATKTSTN